jgi:hypothetical protein
MGRDSEAKQLARKMLESMNARKTDNAVAYDPRGYGAREYMILGQYDKALDELDLLLRRNRYSGWWYLGERDPLFAPLRGLPRFRALQAKVNQHRDEQRRLLEEMRRRGEVPRRPAG